MEILGLVSSLIGLSFFLISMFFNFKKDDAHTALTWAYLSTTFISLSTLFY